MKTISVVIPAFNEAENLEELVRSLEQVFASVKEYRWECVIVDDGSSDTTPQVLQKLSKKYPSIIGVELSRNFGKEAALAAGVRTAIGDAVIVMDADLQHPPKTILNFISEWSKGSDVVIGVRQNAQHDSWFRHLCSNVFSAIMMHISSTPFIPGATDFRLLDRKVVDEFNTLSEKNRITRGMIDWLGFVRTYVPFEASERIRGVRGYSYTKLVALALNSMISHSATPLRLVGYLGVFITSFAAALGLFAIIQQYVLGDPLGLAWTPLGLTIIVILFLNGVTLMSLGIISLYIEHIHTETINRPLYVIRSRTSVK